MSAHAGDTERRLVPRWRDTTDRRSSPELSGDSTKPTRFKPERSFLDRKIVEWRETRSIGIAADVVACAIATGEHSVAQEPAEFLLNEGNKLMPSVQRMAELATQANSQVRHGLAATVADSDLTLTEGLARARAHRARIRLHSDPRNVLAYLDLSRAYTVLGEAHKALAAMQKALNLAGEHRHVLRSAARLLVHRHDPDQSLDLLLRNRRTPEDPWLLASAISVATIAGRQPRFTRRARELLKRGNHHPSELAELQAALATLEYYAGRVGKARRLFRASLDAPTENVVAQVSWARNRLGQIEISEAVWRTPGAYEASCLRALRKQDWTAAKQHCVSWIGDEPFSSRPATLGSYIGISLIRDSEFSERCARVGLLADPTDTSLLNNLAVALAYQDRIEEATKEFSKIGDSPSSGVYPNYVRTATAGLLEFRSGHTEAGRDLYRLALERAPRELKAQVSLHWAHEEASADTDKAGEITKQAIDLVSDDHSIITSRLRTLLLPSEAT